MALLEVHNLFITVKQNGKLLEAVKGIDFSVTEGSIVALAGESGCGKTLTALSIPRLLPSYVTISGGTINYNSVSLPAMSEEELCKIRGRDIAMIFQEPRQALNPLMCVGEQIGETMELHGEKNKNRRKKATMEIIEQMRLGEAEKIYRAFPHQLSLGMCQRVMIAIASIIKPRLLIADEAASALDSEVQDQILHHLSKMNREFGTAILFITHDFSLVRRFCTYLIVMYAGKIVEEGPAEALFSGPAHPYTGALIGAIPGKELRGKPLPVINGRTPSIEDLLPGCPFAPRCPKTAHICTSDFPPVKETGNKKVHCYFPYAGAANE